MSKTKTFLVIIIVYILILIPSLYTPIHSDDYAYFLKGLSFNEHLHHYLNWSGRFITDYTSSLLLNIFPHHIYAAINALIFLLMCVFVTLIPSAIHCRKINQIYLSRPTLLIVFITYWITNPKLGETSFWIVGSANYLWPIMWVSIYILSLFYFDDRINNLKNYVIIACLGFLAGLSNENTGLTVTFYSLISIIILQNKKLVIIGFIFNLIGALILILSPGNFVRAQYFLWWYDQPLFSRIKEHIVIRMPYALDQYTHSYIILFIILTLISLLYIKINNRSYKYAILFFGLSIISNIIMVGSPYLGGRNLNTGLFFLLISLSILAYEFFSSNILSKNYNYIIYIYCLSFFIPSYLMFTYCVKQNSIQQSIRESIIYENKDKDIIQIPDWYMTKTMKNTDIIDKYQSPDMPKFYGVKSIEWIPANFNYAKLNGAKKKTLNMDIYENVKLLNVYNHCNFYSTQCKIVFEFDHSINNIGGQDDSVFFIHLFKKANTPFVNKDVAKTSESILGNKYYIVIDSDNLNFNQLKVINFGIWNPKLDHRIIDKQIIFN